MSFAYTGYNDAQTTFTRNIPAGITENVSLVDVAVESAKKDGTGDKVLRFHFQDESGAVFTHTEFGLTLRAVEETMKKDKLSQKDAVQKELNVQLARVKHILDAFIPKERNILPACNSFLEFGNAVVALCGTSYQGRKFRIKLILNNKDWERFPRIPGVGGFIQAMEEKSTLQINPKYDRIEKENAPATSGGSTDPYADVVTDVPAVDAEFVGDDAAFDVIAASPAAEIDPEEAF